MWERTRKIVCHALSSYTVIRWYSILIHSIILFAHIERKFWSGTACGRVAKSELTLFFRFEFIFKMINFGVRHLPFCIWLHHTKILTLCTAWAEFFAHIISLTIVIMIIIERFFLSSFASLVWYHNFHMSYAFCNLFESHTNGDRPKYQQKFELAKTKTPNRIRQPHSFSKRTSSNRTTLFEMNRKFKFFPIIHLV